MSHVFLVGTWGKRGGGEVQNDLDRVDKFTCVSMLSNLEMHKFTNQLLCEGLFFFSFLPRIIHAGRFQCKKTF